MAKLPTVARSQTVECTGLPGVQIYQFMYGHLTFQKKLRMFISVRFFCFCKTLGPCVWLQNFYQSHEHNVTPLPYYMNPINLIFCSLNDA